jgi:outer membrane protein assembly factor BamB
MTQRIPAVLFLFASILVSASDADDPTWCNQFRGPERNGVYASKGLLQTWPDGGPAMLWQGQGIGQGYSSAIVTPDGIFVTGDKGGKLVISALAADGAVRWQKENGTAWANPFPGARGTCTYHRGRLYHLNAHGRLACLDAKTGNELWAVPVLERFHAPNIQWGISECVLVDGDRVFATPGGPETLMVCLNAKTGELVWKSEPLRFQRTMAFGGKPVDPPMDDTDKAGYASPVLMKVGGRELVAGASSRHFFLVDAKTGELVWKEEMRVRHEVIGAIPIVKGSDVFFSAPDFGGYLYQVSVDAGKVQVARRWETAYDNGHGAMVLAEGSLFGSGYRKNRDWAQLDWETGREVASMKGFPKGSAVWSDGRVYAQSERGVLLLLEPKDGALVERGRLTLTDGKKANVWAHPIIHDGRLYLRVNDSLRCYDLRTK